MLIHLEIAEKTVGPNKVLLKDCDFKVEEGAKIGLIGRNGLGKTTLMRLVSGVDKDFSGKLEAKPNLRVLLTEQEHLGLDSVTPLQYIMQSLPSYHSLKQVIDNFAQNPSPTPQDIQQFTEAERIFSEHRYWNVEEHILSNLDHYNVDIDQAFAPMAHLSGGEKRFVELVRMQYAEADLVLLDEPTNHMDYLGKADFVRWLRDTRKSIIVITHDRDVLDAVNEIIELKDLKLVKYPGNYTRYLAQNGSGTIAQVHKYENSVKTLAKLKEQWRVARARKLEAKTDSGRNNAKTQEERLEKEYEKLKESLSKPSFWIDQETMAGVRPKLLETYHKYKDRNIKLELDAANDPQRVLLRVEELSLGYKKPLFANLNFTVNLGDRLQIKGRNGAGKTTLLKAIIANIQGEELASWLFAGQFWCSGQIKLGVYEQEIDEGYLDMSLGLAIQKLYWQSGENISEQRVMTILAAYLFDPAKDYKQEIRTLSGGQKARFQIIKMLINKPNLLILDEPTNHLDLPSIEELEKSLRSYMGAVLYVSHDSYFCRSQGGVVVEI